MLLTFILILSALISLMFTQMNHPLAMGLMLLLQTITVSLITGMTTQSFWFSYILFLVFLGGLLVLFIYVTSLASNEMFSISAYSLIITFLFMSFAMISTYLLDHPLIIPNLLTTEMTQILGNPLHLEEAALYLTKIYNNPTSWITLTLTLYLFLTLIAVIKITKISSGPLRPKI